MVPELSYEEITRRKYELSAQSADMALQAAAPHTRIVGEGDSWFDYPPGLDILDQLKDAPFGYAIYKVAESGDTIENMVYGTEIKSNFQRKLPQIVETRRR